MIKNVIFDLGNVLNRFQPVKHFEYKFKEDTARLCSYLFGNNIWNDYDQGIISKQALYDYAKINHPNDYESLAYLLDHWLDIITPIDEMIEEFVKLSKLGYHTFILSNVSEEGKEVMDKQDFVKYASGKLYSYMIQINKPDPRIYKHLCDTYKLQYDECIFLDDKLENVEAARKLGMQAIQVKDISEAIKELEKTLCLK